MKNKFLCAAFAGMLFLQGSISLISCTSRHREENEKEYSEENEEYEKENGEEGEEEKEEMGADKQLSSWFWTKGYPDASDMNGKYQRAWEEFLQIKQNSVINHQTRTTGMGNWTHVGPKAFGGRILCLAINPTTNARGQTTIFAGSAGGGLWKTYVSGIGASAWERVQTNTQVLGVASLVYHPADTNVLLAGTGEVYRVENYSSSPYSYDQVSNLGRNAWKARGTYGVGILRSTNGGITWSQTLIKSHSDLFGIQRIVFNPNLYPNSLDTVYACGSDGLYRSINAGLNWTRIWTGNYCSDIVINQTDSRQIVIAAGNVTNNPKGVWRSTDRGATFTQITAGGFPTPAQYKGSTRFTLLGTSIIASVGVGDNNNDGSYTENEVYRSDDFGVTWAVVTNSNHAKWQSWFAHGVTAFPGSTTKVFLYGVKKFTLTMAGTAGTQAAIATGGASAGFLVDGSQEGSSTYVHDDVHDVQFVPGSSTTAYWATDGGIYRTTNATAAAGSITFVSCNGGLYAQQFFQDFAQSQSSATLALGGLQDNGVIKYNGTGWSRVIGGDGTTCVFKPDNETIIIASNDTRGLNRSTNTGTSFGSTPLAYLGNIPNGHDDRTAFCSPVAVASSNTNRWYVGSDNIHVSNDAGVSFTGDVAGVPGTTYIEALHKPAISIGVSKTNANKLYVSVSPFSQNLLTDGLYYTPPANIRKSTDGGTTFSTVSTGLPDRIVTDFAISPTNDDSVFVTLGGFNSTHIYVSGNGGVSWSPRGSGLPNLPFNTILIDPANPQVLYAGSDFGVYVSNDRGANWYDFNNGFMDATYVVDLQLSPGGKIRAATHGKGVYETDKWNGFITLPVRISSFSGLNQGVNNVLSWNVSQENNLSRYELQRSTDGFNYETIKTVQARNSVNATSYAATDPIGSNPAPQYFYRLKSVELDGHYAYSEIVLIKMNGKQTKFEVLGNPFRETLTLRYTVTQTDRMKITLTDMQGRLLRNQDLVAGTGTGTSSFTGLSSLPSGIYLLNIDYGHSVNTIKVLKQ